MEMKPSISDWCKRRKNMEKNKRSCYTTYGQIEIRGVIDMKDILDLHTHTIASGHAYNTMNEMIAAAKSRGLEIYGITEHAPRMNGSCTEMYFQNFRILPREKDGMTVLHGVELNILDTDGHVDLTERVLAEMDIGIASMHLPCYTAGSVVENTKAYLNVMKNPYVNIIGHPDDARFPIDYKELVLGAKEHHVLLEVNNSSLLPTGYRGNPRESYEKMLAYCKEYQVPVIMDSDAHADNAVGNHSEAVKVLESVEFPEELIANTSTELIRQYLNYYIYMD